MTTGFSVTFQRWHPGDAEHGEASETGFACKDVSLRAALQECRYAYEASESDIGAARWLTDHAWNDGTAEFYRGITECRSLHFPPHITAASRRRLARLMGVPPQGGF